MTYTLVYCEKVVQSNVLYDIVRERKRQDEKFGEQNHDPLKWLAIIGEEFGEVSKEIIENRPKEYREELVQLAAACVAALECYDKQGEHK